MEVSAHLKVECHLRRLQVRSRDSTACCPSPPGFAEVRWACPIFGQQGAPCTLSKRTHAAKAGRFGRASPEALENDVSEETAKVWDTEGLSAKPVRRTVELFEDGVLDLETAQSQFAQEQRGAQDAKHKRSLKLVLGEFQRRGQKLSQGDDLDSQFEEEETSTPEDLEEDDLSEGRESADELRGVIATRRQRARTLTQKEWDLRQTYVAARLGLDQDESKIVNDAIPARVRIKPLKERLDALFELGLDSYEIVLAIMRYPGILSIPRFSNYGPNIKFIEKLGIHEDEFPKIILRFPQLLVLNIEETIEPAVKYIKSLGLSDNDIRKMVLACPPIICKDVESSMKPRVRVLQMFGVSEDKIATMVRKVPAVLALFGPSRLAANLMYLEELGMSRDEVIFLVTRNPEVIGHSIKDNLELKIDWLESLGMSRVDAARVVLGKPKLSLAKLQARIQDFLGYGFTLDQVLDMLLRNRGLTGYTRETMAPKLEYIQNVMGQTKEEISRWPTALCYSLEKRIIPRWTEAVEAGIHKDSNWRTLLVATHRRFELMKEKPLKQKPGKRKQSKRL